MRCRPIGVALLLLCVPARPASAHRLDPGVLRIRETAPGLARIEWKVPAALGRRADAEPVLPGECGATGPHRRTEVPGAILERWTVRCARALAGRRIGVTGLGEKLADVLVDARLEDGNRVTAVLHGARPTLLLPSAAGTVTGESFLALGARHILTGPDHLLLVLGLFLLVRAGRRLLSALTAFTIGHSITLALAALGIVHVPTAPIEAAIALSLMLLGVELGRYREEQRTWVERSPWAVSLGLGLLHGLGFAGALSRLRIPASDIPRALLSFNLGVEAGQLAFVAVVATTLTVLRRLPAPRPEWTPRIAAYGIGCTSAYWCLERIAAF